jgi:hypothetical protein
MKKIILPFFLSLAVHAQTPPPFRNVPTANTISESKKYFSLRAQSILNHFANLKLGTNTEDNRMSLPVKALAKLKVGLNIKEVNEVLLDPSTKPYGLPGTDFLDLSPLCVRKGDYDFALRGWVTLMYEMWDKPHLLFPETRDKILLTLLTETGNKFATHRTFCGFVKIKETENHILLTEGSRYLTNQLWQRILREKGLDDSYYDNNKNGMTEFLLKDLKQFLLRDFEEYNSRPYKKLTLAAVHNIYEYAEDQSVKEMAKMVLDYLSVKFASSSRGLRRLVPFCRQPEHRKDIDILENDALSSYMALFAGDLEYVHLLPDSVNLSSSLLVSFTIGKYRLDDQILELIMNAEQPGRDFFQLYHHLGFELYTGNDKYLISAGGKFINQLDVGTGKIDGWAVPISIIPSRGGKDRTELIRILGDRRENKRANMCVTKDFACGLNPMIPDMIPATCKEQINSWTFFNFNRPNCPLKYDFYVALYQKPCDTLRCRMGGDTFGFFETQQVKKMSYENFKTVILKNNGHKKFVSGKWNTYLNSENVRIQFSPNPFNKKTYPIKDDRFPFISGTLNKWPHAWGDFMNSNGAGTLSLKNPYMKKEIIFDVTDIYNPRRIEKNLDL